MDKQTYWAREETARELFKDVLPKEPPRCMHCHQILPITARQSFIDMEVRMFNGFHVIFDPSVPANEMQMRDGNNQIIYVARLSPHSPEKEEQGK